MAATVLHAGSRVFRYEVPVDDRWYDLPVWTDPISVGCRYADVVEFWAVQPRAAMGEPPTRSFRIIGTGHPAPEGAARHWGTVASPDGNLVWHLVERSRRESRLVNKLVNTLRIDAQGATAVNTIVELDGHNVSSALRGLDLYMRVGEITEARLDPVIIDLTEVETEVRVVLPDATRDLLLRMGWTPPPIPGKSEGMRLSTMELTGNPS